MSKLRNIAYTIVEPLKEKYQAKVVCNYYKNTDDIEIREVIDYVKMSGRLKALNYSFTEKYRNYTYDVKKDNKTGMFYVIHNGRSMYFSKEYTTIKECMKYYRGILSEQDKDSPHCYLTDDFDVDEGSIVVDAGAAEGNFALDVIDKVSKIILVECDMTWIEALKNTFSSEISNGKVIIIPKMLGGENNDKEISIDALFQRYGRIDFIKMDIEGSEEKALMGAERWMRESSSSKAAICAYHTDEAFDNINAIIHGGGYMALSHTKGYICPNPLFNFKPPYLRRGIIRVVT